VRAVGGVFEEHRRVEPLRSDGVNVQEIGVGLSSQELPAGWAVAVWSWIDACSVLDVPDRRSGGG
jgi:hypothetical protein